MRTIIWFIHFWLYLVYLLPSQMRADALSKAGRADELERLVDSVVRRWAASMLRMAGVTVEVRGIENIPAGPSVIVSNHQGNFDIPILLACLDRPRSFIAKMELKKMPMIRTWMKYLHCIFIDRSDARQSIAALAEAPSILAAGHSIIVFPEGTRSKSDAIGEFKAGALKTVLKAGAPVVPVVIDGSWKLMERQGKWIRPGKVLLTVLPPVPTKDLTREQSKTIADDLHDAIQEQLAGRRPDHPNQGGGAAL